MSESSESPLGIDNPDRMIFDMREKRLRAAVVESDGSQETIATLANGDNYEVTRLGELYRRAISEVASIRQAFDRHGLIKDLETVIDDKAFIHFAWQALVDEEFLKSQDINVIRGMVGTKLVDALLMAVKLPKFIEAVGSGTWAELGSGTGITAAAMAMCGRRVSGIERNPRLLDRSRENQYEVESLIARKLSVNFISGTLPEKKSDQIDQELLKVLSEADVMYSYPWLHEVKPRVELFKRFAKKNSLLILYTAEDPATFTVKEIKDLGLKPLKLLNGESSGELGLRLSESSWWTVWRKQ